LDPRERRRTPNKRGGPIEKGKIFKKVGAQTRDGVLYQFGPGGPEFLAERADAVRPEAWGRPVALSSASGGAKQL